ncbi:MAG: bifunctional acetate--CoA ligase family protein/GNAT family N-acetyltransferase [Parachlamydia sp.]|nr:bifunctional acetate--CoA ligase family protein/GNAT family N-acetyltransferase [Parachlamydia sp.]
MRTRTDPSQDFMERLPQPLDAIFLPRNVAVIGAKDTPGSVGRTIMSNLMEGGFGGKIFPVNPHRTEVLGLKAYPTISALPEPVDLAVVVTPSPTVPGIIDECARRKVKGAIIISAGFKESGEAGMALEQQIVRYAREAGMPIIGPNCLGVMNPIYGLNATFAKGMALKGNVAFISQSGALCTAVLDWSFQEKIGFSSFVSIGSMADVGWGALIDYLGGDPQTQSILIYMETIGDPRSFLTSAREIALEKPIIVIKAGRSAAAAQAAASHTGSLAGSDEVFDAALERAGILRVDSINELFSMASVLGRQPRPKGNRLAIVTNAGGPAVLATDAAVLHGAVMAELEPGTIQALNEHLPPAWSHHNPVDILGDATPERYALTIEKLAQDPHVDGMLAILTPQDMTDCDKTAESLIPYAHLPGKPVLASWMGGESVKKGMEILSKAGIPIFAYPDDAAATFATMWRYSQNIKSLYQTPSELEKSVEGREKAQKIIDKARQENRSLMTEAESKALLAAYAIPVVETFIAKSAEEAAEIAHKVGYPVVLKLFSETITHKTDVGGVKLNLHSRQDVVESFQEIQQSVHKLAGEEHFQGVTVQRMVAMRDGYELILGSSVDPQFGPVLLFGTGGQLVEVFRDRALALPPLNSNLSRRLMEKTKIYEALKGVRGRKPVDLAYLEQILMRFSQMIVENPWIKECDVNPLLASPEEIIALDARIVLFDRDEELPRLAIRPYPAEYILPWKLKSGQPIILRPIRPEDEGMTVAFHKELSENSVRQRYFEFLSLDERIAHERLVRICFNDYDREFGIIAELTDPKTKEKKIIGIGRLIRIPGTQSAQYKVNIVDAFHRQGLGTKLLEHLIAIARKEKIERIYAYVLSENDNMIKICQRNGFSITPTDEPNILKAQLDLVQKETNYL